MIGGSLASRHVSLHNALVILRLLLVALALRLKRLASVSGSAENCFVLSTRITQHVRLELSVSASRSALLLGLDSCKVFLVETVTIFALKSKQIGGLREQVEVTHEVGSVLLADLGELLQNTVHVLGNLAPQINVRRAHQHGESVPKFNLFD